MKAIVWTNYGPPETLVLKTIDKPIPKDNDILVKIHATTVFQADCEIRGMTMGFGFMWVFVRALMGFIKPRGTKILGQELAGEVESVGKEVTTFAKGDEVLCATDITFGAYAQYIRLPAKGPRTIKPAGISYEEAATVPTGGCNALYFARKANIVAGENILINGAGGSIGTFLIQLVKNMGAHVTIVDNPRKLATLQALGADEVIDYTKQDFTKNDQRYDVIFDVVGKSHYSRSLKSLKANGRYVLVNPNASAILRGLFSPLTSGDKKVVLGAAAPNVKDMDYLTELMAAGELKTAIDKTWPLEEIVEAHRYVDSWEKTGHVVITVAHGDDK